jgi:hypothetical protein
MPPLEGSLKKSVLAHLGKLRAADPTLAFRKRHGSVMGRAGDPDIHGVWRGVPFEIELKRPGEEPTPLQAERLKEWGQAGAYTGVVHNMDELRKWLSEIVHLQ